MVNSLRILLVTPDYPPPPGGIQTIVRNLEIGLKNAGHSVRVLEIDPHTFSPSLNDILPRPRWIHSPRSFVTLEYPYLKAVYRRSLDAIEAFNPDIVHSLHVRTWPAMYAAHEIGCPTVLSTYALELGEKALSRRAISEADTVHAISDFTASLVQSGADGQPDVRIIPPSINTNAYERADFDGDHSGMGPVVTLARFVDRKNIATVIRAWDEISEEVTQGRSLVVAGDGPNRKQFQHIAEGLSGVKFPGWVNGEAKHNLLAQADAFAMVPRRNGYDVEGFGIVYIEAQAAGTPVVGSSHGGAPEAIGDAGLVVENEDDAGSVADAIERLLTDSEKREQCVTAASDRIDRFSIPTVTERHVNVYRSFIDGV